MVLAPVALTPRIGMHRYSGRLLRWVEAERHEQHADGLLGGHRVGGPAVVGHKSHRLRRNLGDTDHTGHTG